jgi:hypothetical protein
LDLGGTFPKTSNSRSLTPSARNADGFGMTTLKTVPDSKSEARCRAEARRYIKGEKAEDKQQQVPHAIRKKRGWVRDDSVKNSARFQVRSKMQG